MNQEKKEETPKKEKKVIELKKTDPPKLVDEAPKGIRTELNEVKEQLKIITDTTKTKEKKKRFKIPSKVKSQTKNIKRLIDKQKIQVILLRQSGIMSPVLGELKNGMIIVGEHIHNGADDVIWQWEGKVPTALIPEWDMQPITKRTLMQTTESLKTWIHPQTIMLRAIEAKEAGDAKKKMGSKAMIIIGIVVIAAAYVLFGNMGK